MVRRLGLHERAHTLACTRARPHPHGTLAVTLTHVQACRRSRSRPQSQTCWSLRPGRASRRPLSVWPSPTWHPGPILPALSGPQAGGWARRTLTDEGHGLGVDDAAGQQVEVVLPAVHHHRVARVVSALGTETRLNVREPQGLALPWEGLPASLWTGCRQGAWGLPPPGCTGHCPHLDLGTLVWRVALIRVWGASGW